LQFNNYFEKQQLFFTGKPYYKVLNDPSIFFSSFWTSYEDALVSQIGDLTPLKGRKLRNEKYIVPKKKEKKSDRYIFISLITNKIEVHPTSTSKFSRDCKIESLA